MGTSRVFSPRFSAVTITSATVAGASAAASAASARARGAARLTAAARASVDAHVTRPRRVELFMVPSLLVSA